MRHKFTVKFEVEIEFDPTDMTIEQAVSEITESMHFPCEDKDNVTIIEQCAICEEPKNPGKYRILEVGETIQEWDEYLFGVDKPEWRYVTDISIGKKYNKTSFVDMRRPITEPQKKNIYDDEGNPIFKKSVVPRYRPFLEGEVIEEGDLVLNEAINDWAEVHEPIIGFKIVEDIEYYRKLIK